jgi:cytidine deaminase
MSSYAELVAKAHNALKNAQAIYSGFPVGAALLAKDGTIFTGCNVESSSFGLTICAERVALVKALSEGVTEFTAIAIVVPKKPWCPPCGACRQLLWDYAKNIDVVMAAENEQQTVSLRELLPYAFDNRFIL